MIFFKELMSYDISTPYESHSVVGYRMYVIMSFHNGKACSILAAEVGPCLKSYSKWSYCGSVCHRESTERIAIECDIKDVLE